MLLWLLLWVCVVIVDVVDVRVVVIMWCCLLLLSGVVVHVVAVCDVVCC